MAGGIKGITVEIGGNTTGLSNALKGVNKEIYSLHSELKQVDRALKLDPNNVTLVAQKQQILKEEIAATSEKLNQLKTTQEQISKLYKSGEIDAGQYRAFQLELETTKRKLNDLEKQKDSIAVLKAAFGEVKDKVKEVTDKLQPLITGINKVASAAKAVTAAGIETVGKAVDVAGTALKIYAGTAVAAGVAAAGLAVKGANAADDINTLAAQTGLSTDQIQRFQYATEVIDVPLETLTGSMRKLTQNMNMAQRGTGASAEAFDALGISVSDQNGELRDNQDVMSDTLAALGKIENETQRDAYAMAIFGKSAQDLNPLIKGGAETLKELGDSAEAAGLILSTDALDHLNEFSDSIDILKANASKSGNVLAGVFTGSLKKSTDIVGKAIPSITGIVSEMFSGANGAETQSKLADSLINMANGLISNLATQVPQFLSGLNSIIISLVTALTEVLPTAVSTLLPVLIDGFVNLILGLLPQIPILVPILLDAGLQLFAGLLNALNLIIPPLMDMLPKLISDVSDMLVAHLPFIIEAGFQLLVGLISGITNCIPQLIKSIVALIPVITQALLDNLPALLDAGIQLIIALAQGLPVAIPAIIKALPEIIGAIIKAFADVDWLDVGIQVLKGIADGLWAGVKAIGGVIKDVANSVVNGFKNFFGIKSPSTLFRDTIGKNLAAGLGEGFEDEMSDVNLNMQKTILPPDDWDVTAPVGGGGSGAAALLKKLDEVTAAVKASGTVYLNDVKVNKSLAPSSDKVNGRRQWLTERGVLV